MKTKLIQITMSIMLLTLLTGCSNNAIKKGCYERETSICNKV